MYLGLGLWILFAGVGRVLLGLRYLGGVGLNRGMKNSGGNYGRYKSLEALDVSLAVGSLAPFEQ
jgi:hypothetical protein